MRVPNEFALPPCRLRYSRTSSRAAAILILAAWIGFCGSCRRKSGVTRDIFNAAAKGDMHRITFLLNRNPGLVFDVDNRGWTPLHWAAERGHSQLVELLLANKADINARTNRGDTPLHLASEKG